jgi:hypothetical protein
MKNALHALREIAPRLKLFGVDSRHELAWARQPEGFRLARLFLYLDGRFHGSVNFAPTPGDPLWAIEDRLVPPPQEAP